MIYLLLVILNFFSQDISTYLAVGDIDIAAKMALNIPKDSDEKTWLSAIQALGISKQDKEMISLWKKYHSLYPDLAMKRECLELIAWQVIQTGSKSNSPYLRQLSLIAAYFGQDAVGVEILLQGLTDSNVSLRAIAAELSGEFRDRSLTRKIKQIAASDPEWIVREASIRTLGKIEEKKALIELLENQSVSLTEQEAIATALIQSEFIDIQSLTKSPLTRYLACAVIREEQSSHYLPFLEKCLHDPHPKVREMATLAIGSLSKKDVTFMLNDIDPDVQIAAAYVLTTRGHTGLFFPFLNHIQEPVRMKAATALSATGEKGLTVMLEHFHATSDPYIKATLALGLLGERRELEKATQALLDLPDNKLMWLESSYGRAIAKGTHLHNPMIPNFPEVQDQLVRLEILGILTLFDVRGVEKVIEGYLESSHFGVTALSSILLLTEGPQGSYDGVKKMLSNPSRKIRLQAALILSLWGEGQEAIDILIQDYQTASREMKERILEGLARIASPQVLSFLIDRLSDETESFRLIAAAALLKCLYA